MSITDRIIGFVAPHSCIGCGSLGSVVCVDCAQQAQTIPPRCYYCAKATKDFRTCPSHVQRGNLFSVRVFGEYSDILKQVIHVLKYERAMQAADNLVRGMLAAGLSLQDTITIAHVPTTPQRIRQRGYDQAELLVRALSSQSKVPSTAVLRRIGMQHQVGSNALTRRKQLIGAFDVVGTVPKQILLVDDVLTTGATLEEAARTLKKAGAVRVHALVIAQA